MIYAFFIYFLIAFTLFTLLKRKSAAKKKGLYDYALILSVIVPVAGLIAGFVLLFLQSYKKNPHWIEEYSEYVTFEMANYEDMRAEAKQDLELVPFTSGLELDDPELQKKLIVEVSTTHVSNEGELLKKAVKQKDAETVHYAATTINTLNERYFKQIRDLTHQFSVSHNHETGKKLTRAFARYLESGLLSAQQEKTIEKDFMNHLVSAVALFPKEPIYSYHLGMLYKRRNQYDKAEKQFQHLVTNCPKNDFGYSGLLEIYYCQNMWNKVYGIIDQVIQQQLLDKLPEKYQQFIRQVGGIHVENKT